MDEVDLDQFLKEASDALDDSELLTQFIRDKATIAIERFLVSGLQAINTSSVFSTASNSATHCMPSRIIFPNFRYLWRSES